MTSVYFRTSPGGRELRLCVFVFVYIFVGGGGVGRVCGSGFVTSCMSNCIAGGSYEYIVVSAVFLLSRTLFSMFSTLLTLPFST